MLPLAVTVLNLLWYLILFTLSTSDPKNLKN